MKHMRNKYKSSVVIPQEIIPLSATVCT